MSCACIEGVCYTEDGEGARNQGDGVLFLALGRKRGLAIRVEAGGKPVFFPARGGV